MSESFSMPKPGPGEIVAALIFALIGGWLVWTFAVNPTIRANPRPKAGEPVRKAIDQTMFKADWPFTAYSGELACVNGAAITFTTAGKTYPVNGTAHALKLGTNIEDIWAPDPEIKGARKNIGPIIAAGQKLCKAAH